MRVVADVPPGHVGRGIAPPLEARGFRLHVDVAEPWGGGSVAGHVERSGPPDDRPVLVRVACAAVWIDVAPQIVGQAGISVAMAYDLRARGRAIWLDEIVTVGEIEVGALAAANWRRFEISIPDDAPRAFEGTLCAVRYSVEALRSRRIGRSVAAVPLLVVERRTEPVVRIERTPIGTWRLLEWRAPDEPGFAFGPIEVSFERRAAGDEPLPGEDRDAEILRRTGRVSSAA